MQSSSPIGFIQPCSEPAWVGKYYYQGRVSLGRLGYKVGGED